MNFCHSVHISVQLLRRSDFVVLPVDCQLHIDRELHEILSCAVAAHEQFMQVAVHKNHLTDSICKVMKNKRNQLRENAEFWPNFVPKYRAFDKSDNFAVP